jgi:hypothetical protein
MSEENNQTNKLQDLLKNLTGNSSLNASPHKMNARRVSIELEDLVYFVNKSIKYNDAKSISQAANACLALGNYLSQFGEK